MKENKLIAEFMELPTQSDAVDGGTLAYYVGESITYTDNTDNKNDSDVFHPEDMQFKTSWDWLMPVVKRIVSDVEFDVGYENEYREHLMDVVPFANIEDVYEAVVEFIKNQNN
tara:strand:+ start:1628 stop:1966 length:339 start_codon:yes stop_codon:yes gene_type:complete